MGEIRIIVLTVDGHPSILVSSAVRTRDAFVDQMVELQYGKQADGSKHEWKILENPPPTPAAAAVALPASVKT